MTDTYALLRLLTSPIVAITSRRGAETNGMIANSAARASLSPDKPRVSVYVHKFNHSHDMIFDSGKFVMHVLGEDDLDTVYALGFSSGRDANKMENVFHHIGSLGLPVLDHSFCHFECEVVNVMDTGGSTLFLGAVHQTVKGDRKRPLTPEVLRSSMTQEWADRYIANLQEAQRFASEEAEHIKAVTWRGLKS